MGEGRRFAPLVAGLLFPVLVLPGAVATPSVADVGSDRVFRDAPGAVVAAPAPERSARRVRQYWTAARLRAAVPIEELVPRLGGPTSYDATHRSRTTADRTRIRAPRTTGKLFFKADGADAVCSAASIMTRRRNQVITAGHCVHTGPNVGLLDQPHFYSDWLFVPRYRHGRAPLSRWVSRNAWAFNGWIENEAFRYDQAIISFRRRDGRRLVNRIGGNEVAWGKRPRHDGVRIWGWPAQSPYDGETARRCDGRTSRFEGTADAAMRQCDLTGGASGGPWLLERGRTQNTGRIWAVTSRRLLERPVLLARPIPREIRRMIRAANR